ncbi:hypothetical protein, partial [uncultured Alistipes sp.]
RPQPWQGCALPTELFPQMILKCGAKIGKKNETPNIRAAKHAKFLLTIHQHRSDSHSYRTK